MFITFQTSTKINLIREVRAAYPLSLKEAKDFVEYGVKTTNGYDLAELARFFILWNKVCPDLAVTISSIPHATAVPLPRPRTPAHTSAIAEPSSIPSATSTADFESAVLALRKEFQSGLNCQALVINKLLDRVDELEKRPAQVVVRSENEAW